MAINNRQGNAKMNISIIHAKIKDLESRKVSPYLVSYFKNRIIEIEQYISELELDNQSLIFQIGKKDECIDTLCKLLIISGNADKLTLDFDSEYVHKAIDTLLENKNRKHHTKISLIASCISQDIEYGI